MIIKLAKKITEQHLSDAATRQTEHKFFTFGNIGNTYIDGIDVSYWMFTNKLIVLTNN